MPAGASDVRGRALQEGSDNAGRTSLDAASLRRCRRCPTDAPIPALTSQCFRGKTGQVLSGGASDARESAGFDREPAGRPGISTLRMKKLKSGRGSSLESRAGGGPKNQTPASFERGGAPMLAAAGWRKFFPAGVSAWLPRAEGLRVIAETAA